MCLVAANVILFLLNEIFKKLAVAECYRTLQSHIKFRLKGGMHSHGKTTAMECQRLAGVIIASMRLRGGQLRASLTIDPLYTRC